MGSMCVLGSQAERGPGCGPRELGAKDEQVVLGVGRKSTKIKKSQQKVGETSTENTRNADGECGNS